MKCPHCQTGIHEAFTRTAVGANERGAQPIGRDERGAATFFWIEHMVCSECKRAIVRLRAGYGVEVAAARGTWVARPAPQAVFVFPRGAQRLRAPNAVTAHIAEDFNEACSVLADSPKASAALSRRCLQSVLREQGFNHHDLAPAIQAALDSGKLPTALADNLDAVRNIGNFAAHPMKDTNSGEVLPVEPEEAEWNLDVLEELFDFYYVQPVAAKAKRDALNAKLAAAGKPPMKQ